MDLSSFKSEMAANNNVVWNPNNTLEFLWTLVVNIKSETAWSYISDTSRFNRELGLSPRHEKEVDGRMIVSTTLVGFPQEWVEKPWMWIHGQTISSERDYVRGVARTVQSVFHLQPLSGERTQISIYFGWQPSNWFCHQFLKRTEGLLRSNFEKVFKKIEGYVQQNNNAQGVAAYQKINHTITPSQKQRLEDIKLKLLQIQDIDVDLVHKLCEYIITGDELDLDSIKVIKLAYEWNIKYQALLKICLHGARQGLLNISWNLVCPHCRGNRFDAKSLGDIPANATCEPCAVEFNASDEEAIEIVFKVHPSVRQIREVSYCAAEPAKKSHIKIQQTVLARSEFKIRPPVIRNTYRISVKSEKTKYIFKVSEQGAVRNINIDINMVEENVEALHPQSNIIFFNNSDADIVLKLEQLKVFDYALRPQHVLMFPDFKDLFSEQHLKSDLKLHLGEQALLFSDVVGSTAFYEKVGDAIAFEEVRKHFVSLFDIIKRRDGLVVKTIGDAVMASFPTIDVALEAAEEIQKCFNGKRHDNNLRLRVSVHSGVVIAVHLESGLDYFGSAINKCAKIQGLARAGQLALVDEIYEKCKHKLIPYEATDKQYISDKVSAVPVKVVTIS